MKKQLKTILCILLAVVLLVGCGKAEKPETSSEEKFAEALEPGESIYVEVLDIPYLLPEETFRVEVFPFVTS